MSGCCLTPSEQLFSHIMARTSYIWWDDDDVCFVLDQYAHLDFFLVLAHWNNSQWVDRLHHSDKLSWFRVNQSLLILRNAVCLEKKPQISILLYLVWHGQNLNLGSSAINESTLTIKLLMWLNFVQNTVITERIIMAYEFCPSTMKPHNYVKHYILYSVPTILIISDD